MGRGVSAAVALAGLTLAAAPAMAQPVCDDLQAVAGAMAGNPATILGSERDDGLWGVSITLYSGQCLYSPTSQSYGCVHIFTNGESASKALKVAGENVMACLADWKMAPPSPVAPGSKAKSSTTYVAPDGKLILMLRYYETGPEQFSLQHEFIRIEP